MNMFIGVIFGAVLLVVGVLIVVFRSALLAFFSPYYERSLGKALTSRAKPSYYLYPGIGAIIVGGLVVIVFLLKG